MKFKNTYILLAVALAFGTYIYFVEFKKAEKDEAAKTASEKVLGFDKEQVRKVTIKNSFGEFEIEKDPKGTWQLVKPLSAVADESTITATLSSISNEKYDQIVSEGEADLKTFGLDKPRMSFTVYFGNGSTKTLLVGSDAAISGKLYVMREGEKKVLFASQGLKYQIEKNIKELRDKKIFKETREQLGSVTIKTKDSEIELVQKDKKWYLEKPFEGLADGETILGFFNALESLRATDFPSEKALVPGELKKFGLDHPVAQMNFYDKDKKLVDSISISEKKQNNSYVKVANSPSIYQIFANSADVFSKNADEYRDKKSFLDFNRDEVAAIQLKSELANYNFVKKGASWELALPNPQKEVNQLQVSQLLNKLKELKANEFIDRGPKDIANPNGHVVLKDDKGSVILDLKWGDKTPSGKNILVATQKAPKAFGVDASMIKALPGQTLVEDKKVEDKKSGKSQ